LFELSIQVLLNDRTFNGVLQCLLSYILGDSFPRCHGSSHWVEPLLLGSHWSSCLLLFLATSRCHRVQSKLFGTEPFGVAISFLIPFCPSLGLIPLDSEGLGCLCLGLALDHFIVAAWGPLGLVLISLSVLLLLRHWVGPGERLSELGLLRSGFLRVRASLALQVLYVLINRLSERAANGLRYLRKSLSGYGLGAAGDDLPVLVHKVRGEIEQVFQQLVGDGVIQRKPRQVNLLDEAVFVHVCFAHDEKCDVVSHFR